MTPWRYLWQRLQKRRALVKPPPDVVSQLEQGIGAGKPDMPAVFLFSPAKSGSTMLNRALKIVCDRAGLPETNLSLFFFNAGVPVKTWIRYDLRSFLKDGYCHRGYHYLPEFMARHDLLRERRSILLLRDVRDAATSHYYSIKHEHPVPGGGKGPRAEEFLLRREQLQATTIDDNVLDFATGYCSTWKAFARCLPIDEGLTKVYRYEDVIFSKREFLRDVVDHFQWDVSGKIIDAAVKRVDVFPEEENVNQRARVVRPGNHREKLKPETIALLNDACAEYLKEMSYL